MTTAIYVLRDPRDGRVRYVGKTVRPLNVRLAAHVLKSKTKKTHRDCWIASLAAIGLRPTIECIEAVEANWQERERFWIAAFRDVTPDLTNIADGGEGIDAAAAASGWSPERKAMQSLRTAEMNRRRTGTAWTEERKRLQSEAQRRRWSRPEERDAAKVRMAAVCADPEYRAKQAAAVASSWSADRRQAQSDVAARVNAAPGRKERQSQIAAALRSATNGKFCKVSA